MNPNDLPLGAAAPALGADSAEQGATADALSPLLQGPALALGGQPAALSATVPGVIVGTLLALTDQGQTALVSFAGQPEAAALRARSVVDLQGAHVGHSVVLMFERGDVRRPIVMGVVRGAGWPLAEAPATVDVDADGERMVVTASEQLVLRCGQASITLNKAGQVFIEGTYVSSRSTGVNRVKGGSVQLN